MFCKQPRKSHHITCIKNASPTIFTLTNRHADFFLTSLFNQRSSIGIQNTFGIESLIGGPLLPSTLLLCSGRQRGGCQK